MKKELFLMYAAIVFTGAVFAIGAVYVVTEDVMLTGIIAALLVVGDAIVLCILKKKLHAIPDVQDALARQHTQSQQEQSRHN